MCVMIYRVDYDFCVLKLSIDHEFVSNCMPALEYSYYKHMVMEEDAIANQSTLRKIKHLNLLKYVSTLESPPIKIRCAKAAVYNDCTADFILNLSLEKIKSGLTRQVCEAVNLDTKQFNNLNRVTFEYITIQKEHRPEVRRFVEILANTLVAIKSCETSGYALDSNK